MNRILVLDDDKAVLNYFVVLLAQTRRYEVQELNDSTRAFETLAARDFDLVLLDMDMPNVTGIDVLRHIGQHHPGTLVIVITGVGDVELAVQAMKLGAHDYLCKPVDSVRLVACIDRALRQTRAREELREIEAHERRTGPRPPEALAGFVTRDRKLLATLATVEQIARSDNNVIVYGESGTGKELVARAIHQIGRRADRPFVAVNAAAFASALFDSQFFGHERGAFTGADSARPGLFEEADGGTLFLDEIGDIEAPVQAKLLRVLQGGEYFRLGSTRKRAADVRIISATNKDLEDEVEQGRFRRDLYYRLNTSPIHLPPLRARKGDVELLSCHFLDRYCAANGKRIRSISEPVMELLQGYGFPGNVRELENVIAGAVVLETADTIGLRSLPPYLLRAAASRDLRVPCGVRKALADIEAEHIRAVVEHTQGNRTAAARILGISRVSLLSRLKRLGMCEVSTSAGAGGSGDDRTR
jgi:two-component system, NtrC family, response regulator HydG